MKAGKIRAQIGQWFRIEEIKLIMSTSQDFKTTFKYNLTCIFLSLRAELKNTLQCKTPCKWEIGQVGRGKQDTKTVWCFSFKNVLKH